MLSNISDLRMFAVCFALCFGFLSCMWPFFFSFFFHSFSGWCPPFKPLWRPLPDTSSPVLVKTSSRTSEYQLKICIVAIYIYIYREIFFFWIIPVDFISRRTVLLHTTLLYFGVLFVFPCACVSLLLFHLCFICVYSWEFSHFYGIVPRRVGVQKYSLHSECF